MNGIKRILEGTKLLECGNDKSELIRGATDQSRSLPLPEKTLLTVQQRFSQADTNWRASSEPKSSQKDILLDRSPGAPAPDSD